MSFQCPQMAESQAYRFRRQTEIGVVFAVVSHEADQLQNIAIRFARVQDQILSVDLEDL